MPDQESNLLLDRRLVKLETLVEVAVNEIKDQRQRTEKGFSEVNNKIDNLSIQLQSREEKYDGKYAEKDLFEERLKRLEDTIKWAVRIIGAVIIAAVLNLIIKPQ